jgi:hypothetical protein
VRELQRFHKAQRINAWLKPHEALRRTLSNRESDHRPLGNQVVTVGGKAERDASQTVRMPSVTDSRRDAAQNRSDVAIAGVQAIDRAPDDVQAAQLEAGRIAGGQAVDRAPDAAQNTSPPIIERLLTPTTRPLVLVMLTVLSMVMVVLGLIRILFRHTYAQPLLTFSEPRLLPSPDHVRPVDLSWPPPNQIEADRAVASSLESAKNEAIEDTAVEIDLPRQLRRRS